MSEHSPDEGEITNIRRLRRLVALMDKHDLGEIDLRDGDLRIRLRKKSELMAPGFVPAPMVATSQPVAAPAAAKPAAPEATVADKTVTIKSPMVGTFFAAPNPDAPTFVKVGDPVGPETTVCIIEAMKVFNEIPAEVTGTIVAVLVKPGEPVEFGQPMFKVDPQR